MKADKRQEGGGDIGRVNVKGVVIGAMVIEHGEALLRIGQDDVGG